MKYLPLYLMAMAVIILDQITKWTVLAKFHDFERLNIIPNFFDLTLVYNYGAAFSFLANHSGWQKYFFIVLAFVISGWLANSVRKGEFGKLGNFAAAMIIGGAFGNVIDRFIHGKVVDFILVYYQDWYYPAFNVADSFICVGVALLIIDGIKQAKKAKQAA
ncbi:signal peptidase II [Alysiella crassa]|uniref:Lipoprotein signal peptidase n=1 Tax=Alysiella crassa TaxID=153491 RepID=A0A376BL52_9NEIS|nr:signal peptidase II [Alysiella crassa]UOP07372.1 signal peptidase II [Alysiella crassa]SSY70449.1 Lipoprotein signal peptidase [Alysiella crassa]